MDNNKSAIERIIRDNIKSCTISDSLFCPILGNVHDKPSNFIICSDYGIIFQCTNFYCAMKCVQKTPDNCIIGNSNIDIGYYNNRDNFYIINSNEGNNGGNNEPKKYQKIDAQTDEIIDVEQIKYYDDNEKNRLFVESINGTPFIIAKYVHYNLKKKLAYADDGLWYYEEEGEWKKNGLTKLKVYISINLYDEYSKVIDYYRENKDRIKNAEKRIETVEKFRKNLTTAKIKNEIISEAQDIYRESGDMLYPSGDGSYKEFLRICTVADKNQNITMPHLYYVFAEWHRKTHPIAKVPTNRKFTEHIGKIIKISRGVREKRGDTSSRGIKGLAIVNENMGEGSYSEYKKTKDNDRKLMNKGKRTKKNATKRKTPKTVVRKKTVIPSRIKRLVWNEYIGEQNGTGLCWCCKATTIYQLHFHCGHYISENNGGKPTVKNLRPICASCNLSMGTTNMGEFIDKHEL